MWWVWWERNDKECWRHIYERVFTIEWSRNGKWPRKNKIFSENERKLRKQKWKTWLRLYNEDKKCTLTYGGANDDKYHRVSTSPFCTSSIASEVKEKQRDGASHATTRTVLVHQKKVFLFQKIKKKSITLLFDDYICLYAAVGKGDMKGFREAKPGQSSFIIT